MLITGFSSDVLQDSYSVNPILSIGLDVNMIRTFISICFIVFTVVLANDDILSRSFLSKCVSGYSNSFTASDKVESCKIQNAKIEFKQEESRKFFCFSFKKAAGSAPLKIEVSTTSSNFKFGQVSFVLLHFINNFM